MTDLWVSSRYAWQQTTHQTHRNMSMMFYAAPYLLALLVYSFVAPMLTFFAGILLQLIVAACLADYMDYVRQIALYGLTDQRHHVRNFRTYFRTAFVLFLLLWFINYTYSLLIMPLIQLIAPILLIIPFSLLLYGALFMTPYLESLYIGNEEIGSAFSEVIAFMKRNGWVWMINNLLLILGLYYVNLVLAAGLRMIHLPIWIKPTADLLLLGIFYQFFIGFGMLYRSHFYLILNKGSRQSRVLRLLNKSETPKS